MMRGLAGPGGCSRFTGRGGETPRCFGIIA